MPTEPETASASADERPGLGSHRFWGAHVLLLVAIAVCLAASDWQFHVWHRNREAAKHTLTDKPPVPLTSLMRPGSGYPNNALGKPVTLQGSWMPESTFYVAHQPSPRDSSKTGYWVVTNVRLPVGAIPVLRGWNATQVAAPVSGEVSLRGWLEPSDDTDPTELSTTPPTYGSLSLSALVQTTKVPLYAGYITVGSGAPGTSGLVVTGPTVAAGVDGSTGLLNFLYGIQWLLFVVLSLYLWWRWCHDWAFQRD
ncbi:MAG TPA: SURF1 family cytochrome oxidase biogenesis protein, partial [Marmoricola sp.]|nr:SURF1 family cytochrome oxidase biogenesis protein [Marmoricola sp.]